LSRKASKIGVKKGTYSKKTTHQLIRGKKESPKKLRGKGRRNLKVN